MIIHDGAGKHTAQSERVQVTWCPEIKSISLALLHDNDEDITFVTMALSEVEQLMPGLSVAMYELGSQLVTADVRTDDGTPTDPFEVAIERLTATLRDVAARTANEAAGHTHTGHEGPVAGCAACAKALASMRDAAPPRKAKL